MEPSTAEVAITRGETSHKDVKPTAEQLSAVAQLIASGAPPYVDVASFGPLLRNLSFVNFTYLVDTGGMRKNERPGPTDFDTCFEVLARPQVRLSPAGGGQSREA